MGVGGNLGGVWWGVFERVRGSVRSVLFEGGVGVMVLGRGSGWVGM